MTEGFIRPETQVLPDSSLVPDANLVRPPPNRFTHQTVGRTPFSYGTMAAGRDADGSLPPGTRVVLLREDDAGQALVVDGHGLYVAVPRSSLHALTG